MSKYRNNVLAGFFALVFGIILGIIVSFAISLLGTFLVWDWAYIENCYGFSIRAGFLIGLIIAFCLYMEWKE